MRRLRSCIFAFLVLTSLLGCNPFAEMREAGIAAERVNREAKTILEEVKEYAWKAEAAAQRAEAAAASAENSSKKAEAASQKTVGIFERQLKK